MFVNEDEGYQLLKCLIQYFRYRNKKLIRRSYLGIYYLVKRLNFYG